MVVRVGRMIVLLFPDDSKSSRVANQRVSNPRANLTQRLHPTVPPNIPEKSRIISRLSLAIPDGRIYLLCGASPHAKKFWTILLET